VDDERYDFHDYHMNGMIGIYEKRGAASKQMK
jgi:hypothetical protein